jgi:hypothetical protein
MLTTQASDEINPESIFPLTTDISPYGTNIETELAADF